MLSGNTLYHHVGLVVEMRLCCCLVLLSTDGQVSRQEGRASSPAYVLNWQCIHATFASPSPMWTYIFPGDLGFDHTQTGTVPSLPLTGLGGRIQWRVAYPGLCVAVLLSPCDHAVYSYYCRYIVWLTAVMIILWSWRIFLKRDMCGMWHKSL